MYTVIECRPRGTVSYYVNVLVGMYVDGTFSYDLRVHLYSANIMSYLSIETILIEFLNTSNHFSWNYESILVNRATIE